MIAPRALFVPAILLAAPLAHAADYFAIRVVDESTGRGVPLVQLETTDKTRYYTDSNGLVAFHEPGLMDEDVWFSVSSHGYEFPRESFGARGVTLRTTPGGSAELKIRRRNLAERLYRITGRGIYRDSVLLDRDVPIEQPVLNGKVIGQDSCLTAIYRGRLHWFWGDTVRPAHPLGNFFMSGATSRLPDRGGLAPSVGVDLEYFVDPASGFAKPMADDGRSVSQPIWADAILTIEDAEGRERMFAHYSRVEGLEPVERGLMLYNDENERFEAFTRIPLDAKAAPGGHPFRAVVDGEEYFYFPLPYPSVRVRADWDAVRDITAYEGFTCLVDGATYDRDRPPLDRDADGRLRWRWRKDTAVPGPRELQELIDDGHITAEECPFRLRDVEDGEPFLLHTSSVYWNAFRSRWVMVGLQLMGESLLGEVWLAEAHAPEGPWIDAQKIATHAMDENDQDFYNPVQHPYFSEDGGRLIYFEGTYVNTFSGNPYPTPRYDYNQLMYRLDLSDSRLKLPEPPPGLSDAAPSEKGH